MLVDREDAYGGTPLRVEDMGVCTKEDHDVGGACWTSCFLAGAGTPPAGEYEQIFGVVASYGLLKLPAARARSFEVTAATQTAERSNRNPAKWVGEPQAFTAGEPRACNGRTEMRGRCRFGTGYLLFRSTDMSQKHSRRLRL